MNFRLLLSISLVHLKQRHKQTIVAALGVTFGIGMYITMVSFMGGLNDFMDGLTLENTADIRMYSDVKVDTPSLTARWFPDAFVVTHHYKLKQEKRKLKDGPQLVELLEAMPGVRVVAPQLSTQVFYSFGTQEFNGTLEGIVPDKERRIFNLDNKIKQGRLTQLVPGEDNIILGAGLARKLGLNPGDRVTVTSPQGARIRMRIVGLLETGMMYLDESKAYSSLATVQKLMGVDKSYLSDINLRLSNRELAMPLAQRITRQFGYKALDWKAANAAFETGSGIRSIMALAVSITLLVVAGFGIYNILNMTIYEKMRDIAILKAMGFDGNDITGIFLSQAIIIGLLGGLAGLLLGLGLCSLISVVPFKSGAMFSMNTLPVNFHADTYILGIVFALLTTALAGWLPARKAARLDPVDIINA